MKNVVYEMEHVRRGKGVSSLKVTLSVFQLNYKEEKVVLFKVMHHVSRDWSVNF